MTKADIARIVYECHGGLSNREAARWSRTIFDSIKARLSHREEGPDHWLRDLRRAGEARAPRAQSADGRGDGHPAAVVGRVQAIEALCCRP